jgi:HEAT repeat protein
MIWAGPASSLDQIEQKLKRKPTVPVLIEALREKDDKLRALAAWSLYEMERDARPAVAALTEALSDAYEQVRAGTAAALGAIGPAAEPAVPALMKMLQDREGPPRRAAVGALGRIGGSARTAVPALVRALKDKDLMGGPLDALGDLGPAAKEAVPALTALLEQGWGREAARALGQIGPPAKPAVPALIKLLDSTDPQPRSGVPEEFLKQAHAHARIEAALALWRVARQRRGIPVLVDLVQDKAGAFQGNLFHVREYAAAALGEIGPAAQAAVPALIQALRHENYRVREAAAAGLGGIGPEARPAVPALVALVQKKDTFDESQAAVEALGKMGPAAKAAVPALAALLSPRTDEPDPSEYLRVAAAEALWKIDQDARVAVPALVQALQVKAIINPVGPWSYGVRRGVRIRCWAAEVLGGIGPPARKAAPLLADLARNDESLTVREAAAAAVQKIDPAAAADRK